jgi:hypothetical protein
MLLRKKPVVRVKNILGDDVYGLWHVKKIVLQNNGRRYIIIPNKETFSTKDDAEHYAHLNTRRFVERKLGQTNHNPVRWRAIKYLFAATIASLMTIVAIRWFGDLKHSHPTET